MFDVYDVVLQTTGAFRAPTQVFLESPPIEGQFQLMPDVWIGRLPNGVKGATVLDACSPAGQNFSPIRQFGVRYSFVRALQKGTLHNLSWDEDQRLGILLFLSRLIHPTTVASIYSARLEFEGDELRTIIPGHVQGYGTQVWLVADDDWRDWLNQTEADQLKKCAETYRTDAPRRVRRARGFLDHAFHTYYLDQKIASLVSAYESLLKVGRNGLTRQFKEKVPLLAQRVGLSVEESEAEIFYDDRSSFVHGSGLQYTGIDTDVIKRFQNLEKVLRRSLLLASTDPNFVSLFEDDDAVERNFGK